jgi:hypothetical protein
LLLGEIVVGVLRAWPPLGYGGEAHSHCNQTCDKRKEEISVEIGRLQVSKVDMVGQTLSCHARIHIDFLSMRFMLHFLVFNEFEHA